MRHSLVLAAMALLAACGRPEPIAEGAENASELPAANRSSASPTGAAPAEGSSPGNVVGFGSSKIPSGLQGRWGLSPGDCDVPVGAAEGLLIVGRDQLRFYESRAVPAAKAQTSANSISGDFTFTGEGQTWTKHLSLEVREGKLVRTERDPLASFSYVRCD